MRVFLVPVDKGRPIAVDKAVVFIGRHPDSDVVLTRSRKISRKHCCLAQVDNRLLIRDLGSTNGVRVNGKRVQRESPLQIGDEVAIGDVCYRVQTEAAANKSANGNAAGDANGGVKRAAVPARPAGGISYPVNLSQEIPVVVPEDGESFVVESTIHPAPNVPGHGADSPGESGEVDADEDDLVVLDDSDQFE